MSETETVAWQHWTDNGYSKGWSANHEVSPDNPNKTLCGRRIPEEGNGIEIDPDQGSSCKRCARLEAQHEETTP